MLKVEKIEQVADGRHVARHMILLPIGELNDAEAMPASDQPPKPGEGVQE